MALSCAACASSGATLQAQVAGRSLELRLRNDSAQAVGYNLCASSLERKVGQSWQPVASQRICTMELRSLPPGQEARYSLVLEQLPPGEYRATARLDGVPAVVTTAPFQLR